MHSDLVIIVQSVVSNAAGIVYVLYQSSCKVTASCYGDSQWLPSSSLSAKKFSTLLNCEIEAAKNWVFNTKLSTLIHNFPQIILTIGCIVVNVLCLAALVAF